VNTYHLPETIEQIFPQSQFKEKITFSHEKSHSEILGSGGGLKKVEPHLKNEHIFLMMNGDEIIIPTSRKIEEFAKYHRESGNLATLLVTEHPGVGSQFGGVWTNSTHQVKGFGKTPLENSKGWHYIGVCLLNPEVFNYLPANKASNILYDGLTALMASNSHQTSKVGVFPIDCFWRETGNLKDYLQCTHDLLEQLKLKPHDVIAQKINDLNRIFNKSKFKLSSPHVNDPTQMIWGTQEGTPENIEGFAVIGENVQLQAHQSVKNSVCYSNLETLERIENDLIL
jgi:NDP-sugar pyrophosphorylase family protein